MNRLTYCRTIISMCSKVISEISSIYDASDERDSDGGYKYADGELYEMCQDLNSSTIDTLADIIFLTTSILKTGFKEVQK